MQFNCLNTFNTLLLVWIEMNSGLTSSQEIPPSPEHINRIKAG